MPIIVEENQKGKLKRRQSYRSQRPGSEEEQVRQSLENEKRRLINLRMAERGNPDPMLKKIEDNSGMKYGGMKKKTKKMKKGGLSKARGTGCAIRGTNFKGIF